MIQIEERRCPLCAERGIYGFPSPDSVRTLIACPKCKAKVLNRVELYSEMFSLSLSLPATWYESIDQGSGFASQNNRLYFDISSLRRVLELRRDKRDWNYRFLGKEEAREIRGKTSIWGLAQTWWKVGEWCERSHFLDVALATQCPGYFEVTFKLSEKTGRPIATWNYTFAFADEQSPVPVVGETYKVYLAIPNEKGTVYFLRLGIPKSVQEILKVEEQFLDTALNSSLEKEQQRRNFEKSENERHRIERKDALFKLANLLRAEKQFVMQMEYEGEHEIGCVDYVDELIQFHICVTPFPRFQEFAPPAPYKSWYEWCSLKEIERQLSQKKALYSQILEAVRILNTNGIQARLMPHKREGIYDFETDRAWSDCPLLQVFGREIDSKQYSQSSASAIVQDLLAYDPQRILAWVQKWKDAFAGLRSITVELVDNVKWLNPHMSVNVKHRGAIRFPYNTSVSRQAEVEALLPQLAHIYRLYEEQGETVRAEFEASPLQYKKDKWGKWIKDPRLQDMQRFWSMFRPDLVYYIEATNSSHLQIDQKPLSLVVQEKEEIVIVSLRQVVETYDDGSYWLRGELVTPPYRGSTEVSYKAYNTEVARLPVKIL